MHRFAEWVMGTVMALLVVGAVLGIIVLMAQA